MNISFWDSLWQTLFVQGAALTIVLAGLSDGLGTQSIVLLVNRITPLRYALNLLLSVALYVLGALAWMAANWLATRVVLRDDVPLPRVIGAVSLAYIPLWFSVLALIPYLGQAIDRIDALYHPYGTKDAWQRFGQAIFPARWPIAIWSRWNRAVASSKITVLCMGPMLHEGRRSYLDDTTTLESGQSYMAHTTRIIAGLVHQFAAAHEPRNDRG